MYTEEPRISDNARMSPPSDGLTLSPLELVDQLLKLTETGCGSSYADFEERLEIDSVEYGVSEDTLTDIFLKRSEEQKAKMLAWFVVTNLAVASVYFLGRFNREFVKVAIKALRDLSTERYEGILGTEAGQPFEMVRRLMHDGGFDAYQAGAITYLSMIGYLDHDDTTKATLDSDFLKAFRMDFARTIPYLHQAESALSGSC
jgi:hypothetical protein